MALDDITKLIDAGKKKGYLTYNEVNGLISHDVHSPEAVLTENSIVLQEREQHASGNEFLGLRKHLSNRAL